MFLYKCVGPNISLITKMNRDIQLLALFMFYKYVECDYLEMYFCYGYFFDIL